jgi:hypothetical protein
MTHNRRTPAPGYGSDVSVAAFVLGIIGTLLAAASLTWNIVSYLATGVRPRLTPVVGVLSRTGLLAAPATRDVSNALVSAAKQSRGRFVVGVEVTNAGRAPMHVSYWALQADPSTVSAVPGEDQQLGARPPCDIVPGATETFVTELRSARVLAAGGKAAEQPQQVVVTVSSGGRMYKSKPIVAALLELGNSS